MGNLSAEDIEKLNDTIKSIEESFQRLHGTVIRHVPLLKIGEFDQEQIDALCKALEHLEELNRLYKAGIIQLYQCQKADNDYTDSPLEM